MFIIFVSMATELIDSQKFDEQLISNANYLVSVCRNMDHVNTFWQVWKTLFRHFRTVLVIHLFGKKEKNENNEII